MQKTEVLIVGAGPTGLLAACQLARFEVPFRIIEKNSGPNRQSRALAIHARSMEIFAQMGIAEQFLALGVKVQAVNYLVKNKVQRRIPLSDFGKELTAFPFLLMLEQSKTEKILVDFLANKGHQVEWDTELVAFSNGEEDVRATLRHADKSEETLKVNWLVGADGAGSTVRRSLNIPFGGQTYPVDLFVLDCKVNWHLHPDEMYLAFSDHSFAGFFPMPGNRCRVIGFVPNRREPKENITFEDISNGFAERMQMSIDLYDPDWISTYHSHHRYVSQFKIGRTFLAGDAAHIHSPVGAQGMNTGLQDAYNLAWKLALVTRGWAKADLLTTYEDERLPFARQLVKTTDRAFSVTVNKSAFAKLMRMYAAPRILSALLKVKPVKSLIFKTISQIGLSYPESRLSKSARGETSPANTPRAGDRLPYVIYEDASGQRVNIQQHIDGHAFHVIVLPGASPDSLPAFTEAINRYKQVVTVQTISRTAESEILYKRLGIKKSGFYLVRPDMHIAYRSSNLDPALLEIYLVTFLIPEGHENPRGSSS